MIDISEQEALRFWTVFPMCLPRTSVRDIPYKDTIIPAGTTFYMVGQPPSPPELLERNTNAAPECLGCRLRRQPVQGSVSVPP